MRGLLDSGRKVLINFLLMLPGVFSDLVALMLLLPPLIRRRRPFEPQPVLAGTTGRQTYDIDGS